MDIAHQSKEPRPFLKNAVFSDGTEGFLNPQEPKKNGTVRISIRTGKDNADAVVLITDRKQYLMRYKTSDRFFDYYEREIMLGTEKLSYYFLIECDEQLFYYNCIGIQAKNEWTDIESSAEECCRKYAFSIIPGFHTPDWTKGAVMYQIYTDRFCNGDSSNDVMNNEYYYINGGTIHPDNWYHYPVGNGVREFYGGDLAGILQKLDYIEALGVEAIYLNPIFVSPSNHKYDIQDYDYIDPHFGVIISDGGECLKSGDTNNQNATKYRQRVSSFENLEASNRFFAMFVEEVHKRGMKVILDGVFNHCGSFNKWMDKEGIYKEAKGYAEGAFYSKDSPYNSFFHFKEDKWPENESFDGWWGHTTLPKLNYEDSPELEDYIMRIAAKWVSAPYNIDGWRLDVAADLGHSPEYNHKFWKRFRTVVKNANPEAIILAEHYGDPFDWLQGDEWDTVMNYDAFMEPVTWFLTGMEKHSEDFNGGLYSNQDAFKNSMLINMARYQTQSLQVAMNELSNHDHSRFLTRTNQTMGRSITRGSEAANWGVKPEVMREAVVMQMTWPGAPTVYYGDEAGLCGWTDPDNRRTYPWGREDTQMIRFHREMILLHKNYDALKKGSILFLFSSPGVISYGRFDLLDKFIVVINNNNYETESDIPVWLIGIQDDMPIVQLLYTNQTGFGFESRIFRAERGNLKIRLTAFTAVVLKNMPSLM